MATFTVRPKVDISAFGNSLQKSDPTKDYWEHVYSDGGDYLYTSVSTSPYCWIKCQILEADLPSKSGTLTNIIIYIKGKAIDEDDPEIYAIQGGRDGLYGSPTIITAADGWVTKNSTVSFTNWNSIFDVELDALIWGAYPNGSYSYLVRGYVYMDYVYANIVYTPAAPVMSYQDIHSLATGNLAYFYANGSNYTHVTEWGFEIRLKSTEEIIKTVTWTGTRKRNLSWTTELTYPDLDYSTTYEGRGYAITEDGTGYGDWIEFTTRVLPASVTTQAATQIAYKCAMGSGTITSGTNATERGFEVKVAVDLYGIAACVWWALIGFIDVGDLVFDTGQYIGTLTKTERDTGDFAEGAYDIVLGYPGVFGEPNYKYDDALEACTSYTYRAYAIIDGVTYYGDYVAFDTLCYPTGEHHPNDDISDGDPTVPIIPIEPEYPPFPPIEPPPEIPYPPLPDIPPWEPPDYPPLSFVGDFYYHKPYTKKDLDELRKKCIIYNKNSVEFAIVLRHNMNVLREFFNIMTDYMDKDEFNDFTDIIPPQRLKELYLDPLEVNDFKDMINGFIRNTVDNNIAVNRNFNLIQEGLSSYETGSDDAYFTDISSAMKTVTEDNPDVDTLKRVVDNLNQETASNFNTIMHNLEILRARLL